MKISNSLLITGKKTVINTDRKLPIQANKRHPDTFYHPLLFDRVEPEGMNPEQKVGSEVVNKDETNQERAEGDKGETEWSNYYEDDFALQEPEEDKAEVGQYFGRAATLKLCHNRITFKFRN